MAFGTQGQTREEIGVAIGRILGDVKLVEADATGSTTTFLTDDIAIASADDLNGKWLRFTSGQSNIDEEIRQITDSSVSGNQVTLTFFPAVSNAPNDGATAEIWDQQWDPVHIHELIRQATRDATGFIFNPVEDITFHSAGTAKRRIDIPLPFEYMKDIFIRDRMTAKKVVQAQVWSESVDADFTVTLDDSDLLFGRLTTKAIVAGTVSDGDLFSVKTESQNLSNLDYIELPMKVDIAVAANDLILRLSATANGADTDKFIAIPALPAGIETWVRVRMDESTSGFTPAEATSIISVAVEYNANSKANTIWIGDIDANDGDSYEWEEMPRRMWIVRKEARDLEFINGGASWAGYSLLKLVGGDNPLLMTSDTDVNEVPDSYIIYRVAGLALLRGDEVDRGRANTYLGMAEVEKEKFQPLVNARWVT